MIKKIGIVFLIIIFLLGAFGCKRQNNEAFDTTNNLDPIVQNQGHSDTTKDENLMLKPEQESEAFRNEVSVDNEEAYSTFSSIEELLNASEKNTVNTNSPNNIETTDVDCFYAPAANFEGYELMNIEIMEQRIFFNYLPSGSTNVYFDYDTGISVSYLRHEYVNSEDPLSELASQCGHEITADGLLYEPEKNRITFMAGDSWMDIRVPDSLNTYEQLKPLCVATKYTVGNGNHSAVTE